MSRSTFYQVKRQPTKKHRHFRWLILFFLMITLTIIGYFFYLKFDNGKQAYQKAFITEQFDFETPREENKEAISILVVGIDYLDEERLTAKQVTLLNVISKSGKDVSLFPLNPKDFNFSDLVWNDQQALKSLNQVGLGIVNESQKQINYTLLIDLDKFNQYFEQYGSHNYNFTKDYVLPQFVIPGQVNIVLNERQLSHSMFPVATESYLDYNRRQIEIVAQTYQDIVRHFYSSNFEKRLNHFFPLVRSNIPIAYLLDDGFKQIFQTNYQVNW